MKLEQGSEAGSYFRLIDCVDHSTLGLRVIKKKIGATSPELVFTLKRSSTGLQLCLSLFRLV